MKTFINLPPTRGIFFLFALTLVLASCSSSTSSNNSPASSDITKPKLLSSFTDSSYKKDKSLNDIPSSGTKVVYTLYDTNATIGGKAGVYAFAGVNAGTSLPVDTLYLHYESNGDASTYAMFAVNSYSFGQEWVDLPYSSQGSSTIGTLTATFLSTPWTLNGQSQGSGTGSFTVNGQSLSVQKVTVTTTATGSTYSIPVTATSSFAPSIGVTVQEVRTSTGTLAGISVAGGTDQFLISYSLK